MEHVAEENESVGRSEQREIASRMAVLIAHLLEWQAQPDRRGQSWALTIAGQRAEVDAVLDDSPSLRRRLDDMHWLRKVWSRAVIQARSETGLDGFPAASPWDDERRPARGLAAGVMPAIGIEEAVRFGRNVLETSTRLVMAWRSCARHIVPPIQETSP